MPDITMCPSETCTVAKRCYRNEQFGTKPCEFRQAWFLEPPGEDEACKYFWERK